VRRDWEDDSPTACPEGDAGRYGAKTVVTPAEMAGLIQTANRGRIRHVRLIERSSGVLPSNYTPVLTRVFS
jgi:hypothetical protein